ncbi:MAG: hypothetical protein IJW09_02360, partial [Clostridia bacterium]|nr:hypothetical protein [Clostridia bacterium]
IVRICCRRVRCDDPRILLGRQTAAAYKAERPVFIGLRKQGIELPGKIGTPDDCLETICALFEQ